jgi:preprotein translocase subunit SecG
MTGTGMKAAHGGGAQRLLSAERAASLGKISLRTWLLLTYLFMLHIMAMVTPRHHAGVGCAGDDSHRLPGTP